MPDIYRVHAPILKKYIHAKIYDSISNWLWHAPHFQLTARRWWTSIGNMLQEGRREPGTCWTRYDNLLVCQLVCCCCNRVTASLLLTCCCLFSQSSCCSFILLHSRKLYGWMESFNGWCCKLCMSLTVSWSWTHGRGGWTKTRVQ